MITIYTDGACSGNPGIGGWGVVILQTSKKPISNKASENNKLENKNTTRKRKEKTIIEKKSINKKQDIQSRRIKFTPKPYRITIKLSGANPSSPSEAVTNALIKAGVVFEVEMIESLEDTSVMNDLPKRGLRR